jgi:hypothetical protein
MPGVDRHPAKRARVLASGPTLDHSEQV